VPTRIKPPSAVFISGVPDTNQRSVCGGKSRGNRALYAAGRHPLARFADGECDGIRAATQTIITAPYWVTQNNNENFWIDRLTPLGVWQESR
jgi:hypothetical protein